MKVFEISKDGLPDEEILTGRIAFIFEGCIVSGWPLFGTDRYNEDEWEANSDVGRHGIFRGVKKYVIFDVPIWEL